MNLHEAKTQAQNLMYEHGLIQNGWRFEFNNRKRSLGLCSGRKRTIYLSRIFTEQLPESEVIDTILHEIAHALVGCRHGHNHVWRAKAREIGCTGTRCAELAQKGIEVEIQHKYIATCKHCGKQHGVNRRKKRRSSCRCAGTGRFEESHELHYIQQY